MTGETIIKKVRRARDHFVQKARLKIRIKKTGKNHYYFKENESYDEFDVVDALRPDKRIVDAKTFDKSIFLYKKTSRFCFVCITSLKFLRILKF